MNSNNPLKQYFRQPAIYIRLPSDGQFYPDDALNMPANKEIPVYPMTAIDEITYRTPDALFNGQAMYNVIQSCVPSILDPWSIPAMDVDTILISVRIASYGHEMEFGTQCPKCQHTSDQTIDLRQILERIRRPDYSKKIQSRDMEIYFRPMTYRNLNENNQMQFEQQKIIQVLPDADMAENEKLTTIGEALKRITDITVHALAQSIAVIKTPDAIVTEPEFIEDFFKNCDRSLFNQVKDHIIDLKGEAEIQPMKVTCPECQNQYDQLITLDMTSFFGVAS